MQAQNRLFQGFQFRPGCLEKDEHFHAAFDLPLPPVMRFDLGDEIGAGHQPFSQGRLGQSAGALDVGCSHQHNRVFARCYHAEKRTRSPPDKQVESSVTAARMSLLRWLTSPKPPVISRFHETSSKAHEPVNRHSACLPRRQRPVCRCTGRRRQALALSGATQFRILVLVSGVEHLDTSHHEPERIHRPAT